MSRHVSSMLLHALNFPPHFSTASAVVYYDSSTATSVVEVFESLSRKSAWYLI